MLVFGLAVTSGTARARGSSLLGLLFRRRRSAGGRRRGGLLLCTIKAAVLWFLLRQEEDLPDTCFFDLAGLSSSGRLRRRTPLGNQAWRLSDRVGFGRAQPCFF